MRLTLMSILLFLGISNGYADGYSWYIKGQEAYMVKEYDKAREYWEKAIIEGGPDETFNNLGYLWFHGLGGKANHNIAIDFWRKASALSVSESQWHLGYAYETGQGVQTDLVLAYAWYKCAIATSQGLDDLANLMIGQDARKSLSAVTPKLTKEELNKAENIASKLISKYALKVKLNTHEF